LKHLTENPNFQTDTVQQSLPRHKKQATFLRR